MYDEFNAAEKNKVRKTSSAELDREFDINYYLNLMLLEDAELQKKYRSIRVSREDGEIHFEPVDTKPEKKSTSLFSKITNKAVHPLWTSLNIASFVYWILWIGCGIFTGDFLTGISALPALVGFGLPILAGLAYPAIKIFNYFKKPKHPSDPPEKIAKLEKATIEASGLFRRALMRKQFDLKKARLIEDLAEHGVVMEYRRHRKAVSNYSAGTVDKKIVSLSKNKWKKTAITLLSVVCGTYVAAQYGSWIVMDIVSTIIKATKNIVDPLTNAMPIINLVLGTFLLVVSAIIGIKKAYDKYMSVKKHQSDAKIQELEQTDDLVDLEERLENIDQSIRHKQQKLGEPVVGMSHIIKHNEDQYFEDVKRKGPSALTDYKKLGKRIYHFINGFCTGAFIGRIFLVKNTAIALPFAAASLSTPVSVAILMGIGIAYGIFKTYEYIQKRKEQKAEELLNRRAERIECLMDQISVADLENRLYKVKLAKVKDYSPAAKYDVSLTASAKRSSPAQDVSLSASGLFGARPVSHHKATFGLTEQPAIIHRIGLRQSA